MAAFQILRLALGFCALFWLQACSLPPSQQFVTYEQSFVVARSAADDVMAVFSEYERIQRRGRTTSHGFDPDLADVYVAGAPTPVAAEVTKGFAAATVFNEVLARYLRNETVTISAENSATIATSLNATGALVGNPTVGTSATAALGALSELASLARAKADRAAFDAAINYGSDTVDRFLAQIRLETETYFRTAYNVTDDHELSQEKLDAFRSMLANFVLLIDRTRADLNALQAAVQNPALAISTTDRLALSAQEIDRYAQRIVIARDELRGLF